MDKRVVFVGSTPFIPANAACIVEIFHCDVSVIRQIVADAKAEGRLGTSYCGHPKSAEYLGVIARRAECSDVQFEESTDAMWVGVRPLRRPQRAGEELEVTPENFRGWIMIVHSYGSEIIHPLSLDD